MPRISGSSSATRIVWLFALPAISTRYSGSTRRSNPCYVGAVGRLGRRLIVVTFLAIAVFAGFSVYADVSTLGARLQSFAPWAVIFALVLALGNYALRFLRWQLYLRVVDASAPTSASALVFLSGFAMSVTP